LLSGNYPQPSGAWDEFLLTPAAATSGGVALYWGDVFVNNSAYGDGNTIDNGQMNRFIARPRNYSSVDIPSGGINATFRIANWGSVGGNQNQINFSDSEWSYIPGNSELVPVLSNTQINQLTAPNNPTGTPIKLETVMNLPAGKSLHQCVLVTMSGTNLNFLNDALYQNMSYDSASLLEREAEINIRNLVPFSPAPRDVYLAIEKVNMLRDTPGANEGRFLESSMARLMRQGGPLADKLKAARAVLSDVGDSGSGDRLEGLMVSFQDSLIRIEESGSRELRTFLSALNRLLTAAKASDSSAKRLEAVFDKLADWLEAAPQSSDSEVALLSDGLDHWLSGVGVDDTVQIATTALLSLRAYHSAAFGSGPFSSAVEKLARWLGAGRPPRELSGILAELRQSLNPFSNGDAKLKTVTATFSRGVALWLRGSERLETLVRVLSDVGLTEEEVDQLFPTFRVHVYHDTGERVTGTDGNPLPVLQVQSSFGLYVYHEGSLEGWQTSIAGAQRIADNLYLLAVPNNGAAKIKVRVQAVEAGTERIPEDPIKPRPRPEPLGGCLTLILRCLAAILRLFGIGKKSKR
jgi:hypothetical protein